MKKTLLACTAAIFALTACNPAGTGTKEIVLENELDSVSYALGCLTSQNYSENLSDEFDMDILAAAMVQHYNGDSSTELLIDIEAADALVSAYAKRKYDEKTQAESSKNLDEGLAFLQENGTKEGVVTLESGLQYKVIQEGTGKKPGLENEVSCHYTGRMVNGKVFDSSVQRGTPASFAVTGVIRGWTEALQLMPVGSKWELYIPSELAYGPRGNQGIPPNSVLIFELELLDIIK